MAELRFGPARVPSQDSPEEAIALLRERGFTACEIDFEGKFWMEKSVLQRLSFDLVCLVADVAPAKLDGYARPWLARSVTRDLLALQRGEAAPKGGLAFDAQTSSEAGAVGAC